MTRRLRVWWRMFEHWYFYRSIDGEKFRELTRGICRLEQAQADWRAQRLYERRMLGGYFLSPPASGTSAKSL